MTKLQFSGIIQLIRLDWSEVGGMDRGLIDLYVRLEELKLQFNNSFTNEDKENTRYEIIKIKQLIYEIENRRGKYENRNET